jgi:hypothetical protein
MFLGDPRYSRLQPDGALQNRAAEIDTDLILCALRCRNQGDDPERLFVEPSNLIVNDLAALELR